MKRGGWAAILAVGVLAMVAAASQPAAGEQEEYRYASPGEDDPVETAGALDPFDRSYELVRLDCETIFGRRDVTLFGNGTARLRAEGAAGEGMALAELSAQEVADYVELFAAVDLSEVPAELHGPEGDSVESCVLAIALPGRERREFRFRRFDSLPLALARLLTVTATIEDRIGPPGGGTHLPLGYEPAPGDVLKRADGNLFRVIELTVDGKGVELQGVDQPLVLYIAIDGLDEEMVELVERSARRLGAP